MSSELPESTHSNAAQPGCCPGTPWPQKRPLPFIFFLLAEPWAWSSGMFHLFLTVEALLQAPGLWGWRGCSRGCGVAGSPGTSSLRGEVRKGSFQGVCLDLTPISTDECSSPPGTVEKQWYFTWRTREDCAQFNIWKWSKEPPTKTFVT